MRSTNGDRRMAAGACGYAAHTSWPCSTPNQPWGVIFLKADALVTLWYGLRTRIGGCFPWCLWVASSVKSSFLSQNGATARRLKWGVEDRCPKYYHRDDVVLVPCSLFYLGAAREVCLRSKVLPISWVSATASIFSSPSLACSPVLLTETLTGCRNP